MDRIAAYDNGRVAGTYETPEEPICGPMAEADLLRQILAELKKLNANRKLDKRIKNETV